jgi:hypothetical protein
MADARKINFDGFDLVPDRRYRTTDAVEDGRKLLPRLVVAVLQLFAG